MGGRARRRAGLTRAGLVAVLRAVVACTLALALAGAVVPTVATAEDVVADPATVGQAEQTEPQVEPSPGPEVDPEPVLEGETGSGLGAGSEPEAGSEPGGGAEGEIAPDGGVGPEVEVGIGDDGGSEVDGVSDGDDSDGDVSEASLSPFDAFVAAFGALADGVTGSGFGSVGGTVSSADGSYLGFPVLKAYRSTDDGWSSGYVQANSNTGTYEFPFLEPGIYAVCAEAEGFLSNCEFGFDGAVVVTVEEDQSTVVDVVLEPAPVIRVHMPPDTELLWFTLVNDIGETVAESRAGYGCPGELCATYVALFEPLPGTYYLRAGASWETDGRGPDGFRWYEGKTTLSGATPIVFTGEDAVRIDWPPGERGTLGGTVTETTTGEPIWAVDVKVYSLQSGAPELFETTYTDIDGIYETDLPAGDYAVCFEKMSYYATRCHEDVRQPEDADPVTINPGEATELDIDLGPGGGIRVEVGRGEWTRIEDGSFYGIDGPAYFYSGQAQRGVSVTVTSLDDGQVISGMTGNPDGLNHDYYWATSLPPGDYQVCISGVQGSECWFNAAWPEDADILTVEAGRQHVLGFDMMPGARVAGQVVDDVTGQPVEGVRVDVFNSGHQPTPGEPRRVEGNSGFTGADGRYSVGVDPGGIGFMWPGVYAAPQAGSDVHSATEMVVCFDARPVGGEYECHDDATGTTFGGSAGGWPGFLAAAMTAGVTPVNGSRGATTTVDAAVRMGRGTISGSVTAGGASLEDVSVSLHDASTGAVKQTVSSDELGAYSFDAAFGRWVVCFDAIAVGYAFECFDEAGDWADATEIEITHDEPDRDDVDADLKAGGWLGGYLISDEDSSAVETAFVSIFRVDGDRLVPLRTVSGTPGGEWEESVPVGTYVVCFSAPGFAPECYDDVASSEEAARVEVLLGARTEASAVLASGGSIVVEVTEDGTGTPIEGVLVKVLDAEGEVVKEATTGSSGTETIVVPAGTFTVCVEPPDGWVAACAPDAVTLRAGDTVDVSVSLEREATIEGTVVEEGTNDPLEGVIVDARRWSDGAWATVALTGTGPDGTYELKVPAGAYAVCFTPVEVGLVGECYWNARGPATAASVEAKAGEPVQVDAALEAGGVIVGQVTVEGTGEPIEDVTVLAHRFDPTDLTVVEVVAATTGPDGTYSMPVPIGDYALCFHGPGTGYTAECWDDMPSLVLFPEFTVSRGDELTRNAALVPGGLIFGLVTDEVTFESIPVAAVTAYRMVDGSPHAEDTAVTDDSGSYQLSVPVGEYGVCLSVPTADWRDECWDDRPVPATVANVPVEAGDLKEVNLALTPVGSVYGVVTLEDVEPPPALEGVDVVAYRRDAGGSWRPTGSVQTGPGGAYEIDDLEVGSYTLCWLSWAEGVRGECLGGGASDRPDLAQTFILERGDHLRFDAALAGFGTLTGAVFAVGVDFEPLANIDVIAYRWDGSAYHQQGTTITDREGKWTLPDMPVGRYDVCFSSTRVLGVVPDCYIASLGGAQPVPFLTFDLEVGETEEVNQVLVVQLVATQNPSIIGEVKGDREVSADGDEWSAPPMLVVYEWFVSGIGDGVTPVHVGATYRVPEAFAGRSLRVVATAHRDNYEPGSALSGSKEIASKHVVITPAPGEVVDLRDVRPGESVTIEVPDTGPPVVIQLPEPVDGKAMVLGDLYFVTGPFRVQIPGGTTVTGPPGWPGTLSGPVPSVISVPAPPGQVATNVVALQVGSAIFGLDFDQPARIEFEGHGDLEFVGFLRPGDPHQAIAECTGGDVPESIGGSVHECYLTVGTSLVVWTDHLTIFYAFDLESVQVPPSPPQPPRAPDDSAVPVEGGTQPNPDGTGDGPGVPGPGDPGDPGTGDPGSGDPGTGNPSGGPDDGTGRPTGQPAATPGGRPASGSRQQRGVLPATGIELPLVVAAVLLALGALTTRATRPRRAGHR